MKWIRLNELVIGDQINKVILTVMPNKRVFAYDSEHGIKGLCEVQKHHPEALCAIIDKPQSPSTEIKGQQDNEFHVIIRKQDRVNSLLSHCLRFLDEEQMIVLRDCLIKRTPASQPQEGQDELWEEILSNLHPYFLKEDYEPFKKEFMSKFTLIKK